MGEKSTAKEDKSGCKEYNKCIEILYLMLDNEATRDQEQYLSTHIENCLVCFQQYEVEREIRVLIRTKVKNQPVPLDLATEIRTKIFERA